MGQNCIGIERLIVHADQYDDLYAIFQERVSKLRVGSVMKPQQAGFMSIVDGGAMINNSRFNGIENLIKEAVEGNAYLVGGSEFKNHPYHPQGYFFQPTVVGPVDKSMGIAQQECRSFPFVWIMSSFLWLGSLVFAPVAVLMPYATIEEAIDIANDTRYGLGASVFGPDQDECLKVAKRLECGMVSINDFGTFYVSFFHHLVRYHQGYLLNS